MSDDNHSQSSNQDNQSSDTLNTLLETLFKNHLNGIKIDASIDPSLTAATAQTLMNAVITAYQASLLGKPMPTPPENHNNQINPKNHSSDIPTIDYTTPHTNALNNLAKNVYQFSVAKNYHELREMTDLLKNGDKIRSYSEFRKEALHIHNYYDQHLRTEYNTALSGAYNAASWTDYETSATLRVDAHGGHRDRSAKKTLIKFQTAGDSHVRASHRLLDGIVRPLDDSFWHTYMPPLDWNCRCTTVQVVGDDEPVTPNDKLPDVKVPKLFRSNLAKDNLVFSKDHPYFKDLPADLLKDGMNTIYREQEREATKKLVYGNVKVYHPELNKPITFTSAGMKHIFRDHTKEGFYLLKNSLMINLDKMLEKSKYLGELPDKYDNRQIKMCHVFETNIGGIPHYILVKEHQDDILRCYSVSPFIDITEIKKPK